MGYTYYGWNDPNHRAIDYKFGYWGRDKSSTHCLKIPQSMMIKPLQYSYSWDALIPVVKKVKTTLSAYETNTKAKIIALWLYKQIQAALIECDISYTYKLIVLYIKYYNSQKTTSL